jgi:hypothetical protein
MKSFLIKFLAASIGICSWLVLIGPIKIYEAISDWKWKAGKNDRSI